MNYYDWNKTISYDADVTMVVGGRGIGKTYGLRLQFIRDYLKNGNRFVEVTRHKNELTAFTATYFDRIEENNEFPEYIFKSDSKYAYIAKKPKETEEDKKKQKPEWHICGYFVAFTQAQSAKKWTFSKVRRILLDEAIIDKRMDNYHRYLPNEFETLAKIVDSASRERPETERKPNVYLLANAVDLINPYFARYRIYEPKFGYTWHDNKTMLLHYVKSEDYAKAKTQDTVAGRMLAGTVDGIISSDNEFASINNEYVYKKPKHAKFSFGMVYREQKFGIWIDSIDGYYYVNGKIPNDSNVVFALTAEDNKVNYIAARRMEKALRGFIDLYYAGVIRYETAYIQQRFLEVLSLFGVR